MSSQTTVAAQADDLQRRVQRAISDPGSVVPREKIPYLDDEAESIPQWSTRAVMTVIRGLQAERDTAVSLLAGDTPWPVDNEVLAALHNELDQLDQQTRGGGAQGGEAPPENDRDGGQPSNVAPEPGRGMATPANTLRPDQARHALAAAEQIRNELAAQRDTLRAGVANVIQMIEHLPCLNPTCPEATCSMCEAKRALRVLLLNSPADAARPGDMQIGSVIVTPQAAGDLADRIWNATPLPAREITGPEASAIVEAVVTAGWRPTGWIPPLTDELPAREVQGDDDGPWYIRILDETVHHTTDGAPTRIDWTSDGTMIGVEILEAGELRKEPT